MTFDVHTSPLMNNYPIAVIDSGLGGLSVWAEIVKLLPLESTLYIADTINLPYGNKPPGEIVRLAKKVVSHAVEQKAKLIVVACNTITVHAIDQLRREFPDVPIVGTVPVVKTAAKLSRSKKIGVLATSQTARSDYQKDLTKKFAGDCEVVVMGTDELVPFVERGEIEGENILGVLQKVLKPFVDKHIDMLALGCTHYPFLTPMIRTVLPDSIKILDSGSAVAAQVERVLSNNNAFSNTKMQHSFFTTGEVLHFGKTARGLVGFPLSDKIVSVRKILL